MRLTLGTRGSKLAIWQAEWVAAQLRQGGFEIVVRVIRTSGDRRSTSSPEQADGKGIFVKEIEEALMAGGAGGQDGIDLAVHSLKDLPVDQPDGLYIAAIPPREDARDVLISRPGAEIRLDNLALGARVGTGSPRRRSQLLYRRPDLNVTPIRGNVDTRLRKLDCGEYDAVVMAAAGILRLGLAARINEYLAPDVVCPAPGQGAVAIEIRSGDERTARAVEALDDQRTHRAVCAERAALRYLGGGCQTPIAAYARPEGDASIALLAVVASPDGQQVVRALATGAGDHPEDLGRRIAEDLLKQGARELLHL